MNQTWDEVCDIVTVGSGLGSMCAALVAYSQGKKVIVLEKEARFGGSSARSGGAVWIPCNHFLAEEGIADDFDTALKYVNACMKERTPAASAERIEAYLRTGPDTIRFLEDQGIVLRRCADYADYFDALPGGQVRGRAVESILVDSRELGPWAEKVNRYAMYAMPVYVSEFPDLSNAGTTWRGKIAALRLGWRMLLQKLRGAPIFGQGAALQSQMLRESLRRGIDIRLEAAVQEVIVENGVAVGVRVKHNGTERHIRAHRGVLINSGGFSNNLAMRKEFLPQPQTATNGYLGNPGDTGEVMRMVMNLGAATDQMDEAWWIPGGALPSGNPVSHTADLTKPHVIMVDSTAQRYLNEAMPYMKLGQTMFERHRQVPAVPSWAILDSRHRNSYTWGMAMPGKTPPEWFTSGYMKRADTLEALARECGLDPATLKATVERFNGFARSGRDEDFGRGDSGFDRLGGDPANKPNPALGAIEQAPFFAVKIHIGDSGTCGGLLTNADAQVLREDRTPIAGLYAYGNVAANCFGRSYPGPGITLGQSMIFGYRAARHALGANA